MELDDLGVPEIRERADEYYRGHGWDDIEALEERNPAHKGFKAEAWARKAVAENDLPERLPYLRELSRDESWRVRERVAMALKYVNERAFDRVEPRWYEWVAHDDTTFGAPARSA